VRAAAILLASAAAAWGAGLDDYPPILKRHVVVETTTAIVREDRLDFGRPYAGPAIPWKRDEDDDITALGALLGIGDVVTLVPDTEYTFDLVRLGSWPDYECDDVELGYDYQAVDTLVLRIRQGERIVFDSHVRARSRLRGDVPRDAVPKRDPTLMSLLHAVVRSDTPCDDGTELITRFEGDWSKPDRPGWNVSVHIEQPETAPAVAVLVHDAAARARTSVDVMALEGSCPSICYGPGEPGSCLDPTTRATLAAVAPGSGVFIGLVETEGSHGTVAMVEYERPADAGAHVVRDSQPTFLAFH
jgi:hypothetical protein